MKRKLLIFTLCFTLIFSSFNYKKSYADGGVITLPMIATVSALAVGSGIVISNNENLYDLGKLFYNWIDKQNSLTIQSVSALFSASSSLVGNKVSIDSKFLDVVKRFFDDTFNDKYVPNFDYYNIYGQGKVVAHSDPAGALYTKNFINDFIVDYSVRIIGSTVEVRHSIYHTFDSSVMLRIGSSNLSLSHPYMKGVSVGSEFDVYCNGSQIGLKTPSGSFIIGYDLDTLNQDIIRKFGISLPSFPYHGGYTWDDVENRKENDKIVLPVPGDLGSLVGQNKDAFWGNTDNLVGNGQISIPGVEAPSIGFGEGTFVGGTSIPGDAIVPDDSIWDRIKSFIISLVVPSDTFWTDTWGGLYDNFTNSFPMVDMDGFNDLVTGEKKFPNIDINIMGVKGRVVNGDVVNSIVDWLRPIIAGFMMLCLMLFNYRKIYKLIRNSEPFGSVASGNNSDIRTGISEYSKHEVVKATDMVAEYNAWKERGGK